MAARSQRSAFYCRAAPAKLTAVLKLRGTLCSATVTFFCLLIPLCRAKRSLIGG